MSNKVKRRAKKLIRCSRKLKRRDKLLIRRYNLLIRRVEKLIRRLNKLLHILILQIEYQNFGKRLFVIFADLLFSHSIFLFCKCCSSENTGLVEQ